MHKNAVFEINIHNAQLSDCRHGQGAMINSLAPSTTQVSPSRRGNTASVTETSPQSAKLDSIFYL